MSRRSSIGSNSTNPGQVLHLDAFSGVAGNMFLGALLDLGLSRKQLDADLAGLGVDYKLKVSGVKRGALAGKYVDVIVPKLAKRGKPKHGKHHHQHRGRTWASIRKLLEKAKLEESVRQRALAIFTALAQAEAKVHAVSIDEVHFHEVGAVDAIIDVTGAAIGLYRLGIDRVSCSPIALGHGVVETDHGRLPLPAPATLELLRGIPTVPVDVSWETVTPTGAAIVRTIVDDFRSLPAMTVEAVGYGAGNDRAGPLPNLLRAVLGKRGGPSVDRIVCLECNLDDLVPEHFDHLMERLFDAGALDVSLQHIQMKKNRPGFLIRVLATPQDRHALATILFRESTTIGVRMNDWERIVLERKSGKVSTDYGRIGIKYVTGIDGEISASAEYDDCKRAARKHDAPLRDVVRAAEKAARRELR